MTGEQHEEETALVHAVRDRRPLPGKDAKTGIIYIDDGTFEEVDAYLTKVEQATGLAPEITHMGEFTRH